MDPRKILLQTRDEEEDIDEAVPLAEISSTVKSLPTEIQLNQPTPRLRNAYDRVQSDPQDTEAWQILFQEAPSVSVYGALLKEFPYTTRNAQIAQQLLSSRSTNQTLLEGLLTETLGYNLQLEEQTQNDAMLVWMVDLWLIFIQAVLQTNPSVGIKVYELAAKYCGYAYENHKFWLAYLNYVQSLQNIEDIRKVYQTLLVIPMQGLAELYLQYEQWERAQSAALAQALTQEIQAKHTHARTIYNERFLLEAPLQIGRWPTNPKVDDATLVQAWNARLAHERTNPCQLGNQELQTRIQVWYKCQVSVLTKHVEAWNAWAAWAQDPQVLALAQQHIPDSTFLALAHAQMVSSEHKLEILKAFLERSPNALGFVAYQQMVRQQQGIQPARQVFARARRVLVTKTASNSNAANTNNTASATANADESEATATNNNKEASMDSMVTNRSEAVPNTAASTNNETTATTNSNNGSQESKVGAMTWHVYAAHARMEHYQNRQPQIALQIYQLGLRKHAEFITSPAFCQGYAQLLLELGDTTNLQALWQRAIAATTSNPAAQAALWNARMRFSTEDPYTLMAERFQALYENSSNVATGGQSLTEHTDLHEQLVRAEGFATSSAIVTGLERLVHLLSVQWGSGSSGSADGTGLLDWEDAGGPSDASLAKRLAFAQGSATTPLAMNATTTVATDAAKRVTAASTMMMAIQSLPDWLQSLCLLLPATRLRVAVVPKPPPHMVELALQTLKVNPLPAERPTDSKRNRSDSQDEDDIRGSSGYGSQFRARQRARMQAAN